jgi:hypothetical protein
MWKKLSQLAGAIAFLLTVLGVSAANLFVDAYKAHLALGVFVLTCMAVAIYSIWAIHTWQKATYPKGYIPVATFVRYTTTDGKQIVYETFRQIQVKHAFLTKIDHRYSWTGTKPPVIVSTLQTVGAVSKDTATGWDVVPVVFAHPRYYNDTEIVHLRSTLDDSDEKSSTLCSLLIEHPTKLAQFRIELLHCGKPVHAGMTAYIERRLKTSTSTASGFDVIDTVKFNVTSRSFEYLLANPEPGYYYQIRWDRPANGRGSAAKQRR